MYSCEKCAMLSVSNKLGWHCLLSPLGIQTVPYHSLTSDEKGHIVTVMALNGVTVIQFFEGLDVVWGIFRAVW